MGQEVKWKYVASIYLKRKHVLVLRDEKLGLQMQVVSRTSSPGRASRKLYFVDGDSRAFASEADLLRAIEAGTDDGAKGIHPMYIVCSPTARIPGLSSVPEGPLQVPSLALQAVRRGRLLLKTLTLAIHELIDTHRQAHPRTR